MEQHNIFYRVGVSGLHCRSSVELVNLKVISLPGVEAASIDADHVLTVFADADLVAPSDIVRTLIDTGVLPVGAVSAVQLGEAAGAVEAPAEAAVFTELGVDDHTPLEVDLHVASVVEPTAEPEIEPVAEGIVEPVVEPTLIVAPDLEVAPEPVAVPSPESAVAPALAEIEESLEADIETPRVATSPRAALVQRIRVVVSDDYYPNRIEVIPGVPVDIEFSEGHGCLARVVFDEFEIEEDLTNGGATVRLPGLTPGTHEFSCGMRMVHGSVVAAI